MNRSDPHRVPSRAYLAGYTDGLAWDLDSFADHAELVKATAGWDSATINAAGETACRKAWGAFPGRGSALERASRWLEVCAEYNRGAYEGAVADQSRRTGLPPRS